jgi:hypothetical protein
LRSGQQDIAPGLMTEQVPSMDPSATRDPYCGIYPCSLCQPDSTKSCGACCGLYNWEDHSRAALEPFLRRRTSLFYSWQHDLRQFQEVCSHEVPPPSPKLLEAIHNCEFLGFLDREEKRVGCLLHPSVNRGEDLRNYCFYGADLCAGHFCPSYSCLSGTEQKAVSASLEDWYLYGLVITDIDLVKEFCRHVQMRLGEGLQEERLHNPAARGALQDFFGLKESWKFASTGHRLGKYYFSLAEYRVARIEYQKNWGVQPSRFDKILVSLSSEFRDAEEVLEAESIIEERIAKVVDACQGGFLPAPPGIFP